ncbi:MAG: DUF5683 domain-containing protein [bacterium]|nr:DUF5683 domain-containing protein [bacterium]
MRLLRLVLLVTLLTNLASAMVADSLLPSPSNIALRSFAFPGWGQYSNGKPVKAMVFAGTQLTLGYSIFRQNQRMQHALGAAQAATDTIVRYDYERIASFYENDRNKFIWWSAGALLLSVYDAFVDAHLRNFEVGPSYEEKVGTGVRITVWF